MEVLVHLTKGIKEEHNVLGRLLAHKENMLLCQKT